MQLILGFAVGFVAGVAATLLWLRGPKPAAETSAPPNPEETLGAGVLADLLRQEDDLEQLRQNLRVKYLYDEVRVNAAVEEERRRDPSAGEAELLKAAIFRWERENR